VCRDVGRDHVLGEQRIAMKRRQGLSF
jgi:hypothetical protein